MGKIGQIFIVACALGTPAAAFAKTAEVKAAEAAFQSARQRQQQQADACRALLIGNATSQQQSYRNDQSRVQCAVQNMRALRDSLPNSISYYRNEQAGFDLGIITFGLASVGAAFARASSPLVGALTLGGAGFGQIRDYAKPEPIGLAHIKAAQTARCVTTRAELLASADTWTMYRNLHSLAAGIALVEKYTAAMHLKAASDPDTRAKLDAADSAAKQAISAATSAYSALKGELTAYSMSAAIIDDAHDGIKNYLDLKKHFSATVSVQGVEAALTSAIKDQATASADIKSARDQLLGAVQAQAAAQAGAGQGGDAVTAAADQNLAASAPATSPPPAATAQTTDAGGTPAVAPVPPPPPAQGAPAPDQPQGDTTIAKAGTAGAAAAEADARLATAIASAKAANTGQHQTAPAFDALVLAGVVGALNRRVEAVLRDMPEPSYTAINTLITGCTAGL